MSTLPALLVANGYAQNAAAVAAATLLGDTPAMARERVNAIAQNYYMQYLAIQLNRYGFDLNRPRLRQMQFTEAEALIAGKMGNEPLDNPKLADLLASLVDDVIARHNGEKMTWSNFYMYEFHAGDNIVIRGEDMMKALLKSNNMHYGSRCDIYHHTFNDVEYKTTSMHHMMARILSSRKAPVPGVTTYGLKVQESDVKRARDVVSRITTMRDPKLLGFFQQNAHHNIKQKLVEVFKELLSESTDLHNLHHLHVQLVRSNFNPAMYNPEWQALLLQMQEGLQLIATPYAKTVQPQHVTVN